MSRVTPSISKKNYYFRVGSAPYFIFYSIFGTGVRIQTNLSRSTYIFPWAVAQRVTTRGFYIKKKKYAFWQASWLARYLK